MYFLINYIKIMLRSQERGNMEDLNILKSGMEYLKKAMECFRQCDLVTDKEYYQISDLYYNTLTTRKIEKEIEVESVRMEN